MSVSTSVPTAREPGITARLGLYLRDASSRRHWKTLLDSPECTAALRGIPEIGTLESAHFSSLDDAVTWVASGLARDRAGLLLSDAFLEADDTWRPGWRSTSALTAIATELSRHPYVSIAGSDSRRRPPDVDLVMSPACSVDALVAGLRLLAQRLLYYIPPARDPSRRRPDSVEVRPLRDLG